MADYTSIDYLFLAIFVLNALLGLGRGLLREMISNLSILIALAIAIKFTAPITDFLNHSDGFQSVVSAFATFTHWNVSSPLSYLSLAVSFLVLFVGVFSIGEGMNYYVQTFGVLMFPTMAAMDRALGAMLGLFRGYMFNLILILMLGMTPLALTSAWSQSHFMQQLKSSADQLGNFIQPGGFPTWSGISSSP